MKKGQWARGKEYSYDKAVIRKIKEIDLNNEVLILQNSKTKSWVTIKDSKTADNLEDLLEYRDEIHTIDKHGIEYDYVVIGRGYLLSISSTPDIYDLDKILQSEIITAIELHENRVKQEIGSDGE